MKARLRLLLLGIAPFSLAVSMTVSPAFGGKVPSSVTASALDSTDIVPPKTSTPTATPPGGLFATSIAVTLSTATPGAVILYTTDGTQPDSLVGAHTKQYALPIVLSATTTLRALAVKPGYFSSEVMTETYALFRPITVSKGWYKDLDGDGRIETAFLQFSAALPMVPAKLAFKIRDHKGAEAERLAGASEIRYDSGSYTRVKVLFSEPFPYGMTSVANVDSSGKSFRQDNIPLTDFVFGMEDSVPPILINASVAEKSPSIHYASIHTEFSEIVDIPLGGTSLRFNRDGWEFDPRDAQILWREKLGEWEYLLRLDSGAIYIPKAGDSVAIGEGGNVRDLYDNVVKKKRFLEMGLWKPTRLAEVGRPESEDGISVSGRQLRFARQRDPAGVSVECFNLNGGSLGFAVPVASSGAASQEYWELPAARQSMILLIRSRDGARRHYLIRP